jgi:hypothetical protein
MGRAQKRAVGVDGFDTVLGVRRGSPSAQAQRDVDERVQRRSALERALDLWVERITKATGSCAYTPGLAATYRDGVLTGKDFRESSAADMLERLISAGENGNNTLISELIAITVLGDPVECPGISWSAVSALGRYFESESTALSAKVEHPRVDAHARRVLDACFFGPYENEFYQRLLPLCQGLGTYLNAQSSSQSRERLLLRAAQVLRSAPIATLERALASWVEVFALRAKNGTISEAERNILSVILVE